MELKDQVADYWDRRSSGFSEAVLDEIQNGTNPSREEISRWLGIAEGAKVLDVGCGPGYFEMLLGDSGAEFHAVDYSKDMVERARENARKAGIAVEIRRMDAQDLDYPDGTFDAVLSRDVLWSLPDPEAAYREMLRVMKPGARAYIRDGNYYLHLHDGSYRRKPRLNAPPREDRAGSHYRFNADNVDFREMDAMAEALPASRRRRPQWDAEILASLPCSEIRMRLSRFLSVNDESLIGSFEIFFAKEGSIE